MKKLHLIFSLIAVFLSTVITHANDNEKPIIYVGKSIQVKNKNSLAKYNFVNVDKDVEFCIGKNHIKKLNNYIIENIDLNLASNDTLCGNSFFRIFHY